MKHLGLALALLASLSVGCLYSVSATHSPTLGDTCRAGPADQYDDFEWDQVLASCNNAVRRLTAAKIYRHSLNLPALDLQIGGEISLSRSRSENYGTFQKFAQIGGLSFPGPGLPVASGGGAVTWTTFTPPAIQAGTANPQYFPSANVGTAASNRVIVVGVGANANGPSTAVLIGGAASTCSGGISATLAESSGGSANSSELWYASVPTGTTANVCVTLTAAFPTTIGIIVGALTTTTPTAGTGALAAGSAFRSDPQVTSTPITVPSNGIGIVFGNTGSPNASPTFNNWIADQQVTSGVAQQLLLGHVGTGSQTPSISGYSFASFGIAAAPWGP